MKGFKGMLNDRLPSVIGTALCMCGAKGRWVDHTYEHFVNIYVKKEDKKQAVFKVLGPKYDFDFTRSIDWDNISAEEQKYWKYVESWVDWVSKNALFIEQDYNKTLDKGYTHEQIIDMFSKKYQVSISKMRILLKLFVL